LLAIVLCLCGGVVLASSSQPKQPKQQHSMHLFKKCDFDGDQTLNYAELEECGDVVDEFSNPVQVDVMMKLFDTNRDNAISAREYVKVIESQRKHNPEDEVILKSKDGTTRTVPRSELMDKMKDTMGGISMEGGDMQKEESGTKNLTEIAESNPQLSNFIRIAQWARFELIQWGYVEGNILHLKSWSKDAATCSDSRDDLQPVGPPTRVEFGSTNFTIGMTVTIGSPSNFSVFQISVEYNKQMYYKPHLAMLELWEVVEDAENEEDGRGGSGSRTRLHLPEPKTRSVTTSVMMITERVLAKMGMAGVDPAALWVVVGSTAVAIVVILVFSPA
jgi:Ca2+-binding EF-hand superfamily protein